MSKTKGVRIKTAQDVFNIMGARSRRRVECFFCVTLNGAHEVVGIYEVTKGLVNRTVVHPREVFWYAVKDMSSAIVIAHNHPSGQLSPSSNDDFITERMKEAADIMGIHILDHIILSKKGFYSYSTEGFSFSSHDFEDTKV
jgi:DNA repair protein RadC